MTPTSSGRGHHRTLTLVARFGLAAAVAFAVSVDAHAAKPLPPLPWNAIAHTTEPVVVREWKTDLSHDGETCDLTPTVVCIGTRCGSVDGQPTWNRVERRFVAGRWPPGRWAGLIVGPAIVGGVGLMLASDDEDVALNGLYIGFFGGLPAVTWTVAVAAAGERNWLDNARAAGPFLSSEVTAFLRERYASDRTTYLSLRDQFNACTLSNDAPLQALPAARSSARASCDTFRTELKKNPRLADPFAEALTEANAAAAAWDAVPMLERVANGNYLGFYQARDTFKVAELPEAVVADTCGRLLDATEGRAISDTTLRTKLGAWTRETCAEKPQPARRRRSKE